MSFYPCVACFSVFNILYEKKEEKLKLIDLMCNFRSSILVPRRRNATMEFHRFHAFIYDRVPCTVRWMDWVNVGLYASRWRIMHPIFLSHRCHWQFSRKYHFAVVSGPSIRLVPNGSSKLKALFLKWTHTFFGKFSKFSREWTNPLLWAPGYWK